LPTQRLVRSNAFSRYAETGSASSKRPISAERSDALAYRLSFAVAVAFEEIACAALLTFG